MCEPVSIVSGVVGLGAAAYQTVAGVKAAKSQGKAERQQARLNQQYALEAASESLQEGERAAAKIRTAGTLLRGQQRVALASSGVNVSSGTAGELQAEAVALTELDVLIARNNATREAWGYKTQGLDYGKQAALSQKAEGQQVFGTLLGGAGQAVGAVSGAYRDFKASRK